MGGFLLSLFGIIAFCAPALFICYQVYKMDKEDEKKGSSNS